MIKFKSVALPSPSVGTDYSKVIDQVVPDQSMSLQEILKRFTRGEKVPVGHEVSYHESDTDLEKLSKSDLVDKAEFVDKMKEVKVRFDKQEKKKKRDAIEAEKARIKAEAIAEAKKEESEDSSGSAK